MNTLQKGGRYDAWMGEATDASGGEAGPSDCDCGGTIRELLAEIAGFATVIVLILLIVRALI